MGTAIDELYQVVSDFVRLYRFRSRDEVCCSGMSVSEFYALEALLFVGPLHCSHLAARLGLELSSATRVVDRLVKKRLVKRREPQGDRRVVEIVITDSGRRVFQHTDSPLLVLLSTAFDGIPSQDVEVFLGTLRRLIVTMNPQFESGRFQYGCCSAFGGVRPMTVGTPRAKKKEALRRP